VIRFSASIATAVIGRLPARVTVKAGFVDGLHFGGIAPV